MILNNYWHPDREILSLVIIQILWAFLAITFPMDQEIQIEKIRMV
jgi:hypothetical protein